MIEEKESPVASWLCVSEVRADLRGFQDEIIQYQTWVSPFPGIPSARCSCCRSSFRGASWKPRYCIREGRIVDEFVKHFPSRNQWYVHRLWTLRCRRRPRSPDRLTALIVVCLDHFWSAWIISLHARQIDDDTIIPKRIVKKFRVASDKFFHHLTPKSKVSLRTQCLRLAELKNSKIQTYSSSIHTIPIIHVREFNYRRASWKHVNNTVMVLL